MEAEQTLYRGRIDARNLINQNYVHRNFINYQKNQDNANLAQNISTLEDYTQATIGRLNSIIDGQIKKEDAIINSIKTQTKGDIRVVNKDTGKEYFQLFRGKKTKTAIERSLGHLSNDRDSQKAKIDTLYDAAQSVIDENPWEVITSPQFNFYESILEKIKNSAYVTELTKLLDDIAPRLNSIQEALGHLDDVDPLSAEVSKFRRRLRELPYEIFPKRVAMNVVGSLRGNLGATFSKDFGEKLIKEGIKLALGLPENTDPEKYLDVLYGVTRTGGLTYTNGGQVKVDVFAKFQDGITAGFSAKWASINNSINLHSAANYEGLINIISRYKATNTLTNLMDSENFKYNLVNAFSAKTTTKYESPLLNALNRALSVNGYIFIGNTSLEALDPDSADVQSYFGDNIPLAQNDFFYFAKTKTIVRVSTVMRRIRSAIQGMTYSETVKTRYTRLLNLSPYEDTIKNDQDLRVTGRTNISPMPSKNLLTIGYTNYLAHWGLDMGGDILNGAWTVSWGK